MVDISNIQIFDTNFTKPALDLVKTVGNTFSRVVANVQEGYYMYIANGAVNDEVKMFVMAQSGIYTITLGTQKNVDQGIIQPYVNLTAEGGTIDLYSNPQQLDIEIQITGVALAQGVNEFKYKVTGKHASSTGYRVRMSYIRFTQTGR